MEKLEEGQLVTTDFEGGFSGEITGIAAELGPIGYMYIVKLLQRTGETWINYPYSCVVLPQSMIKAIGKQRL